MSCVYLHTVWLHAHQVQCYQAPDFTVELTQPWPSYGTCRHVKP